MKKLTTIGSIALAAMLVVAMTACGGDDDPIHTHTPGAAATCTTAQTCTGCGEVLATALGHTPGAAADCTTA